MTEFVYLQGKTKWFRPNQLNDWGKWSHVIYPNAESLEKIRELQAEGVKNVIKKDDDGYFVSIGRPSEIRRKTASGVKIVGLKQPEVVDRDGQPNQNMSVGNGSDITTKCEVYSHGTPGGGKAKAMRWLSTRIDNLIPYEPTRDFDKDEARAVKNLDNQPEQKQDLF